MEEIIRRIEELWNTVSTLSDRVSSFLSSNYSVVQSAVSSAVGSLQSNISNQISNLTSVLSGAYDRISSEMSRRIDALTRATDDVRSSVLNSVNAALGQMDTIRSDVQRAVRDSVSALGGDLRLVIANTQGAVFDVLMRKIKEVGDSVRGTQGDVVRSVNDALSSLTRELSDIQNTIRERLENGLRNITIPVNAIVRPITDGIQQSLGQAASTFAEAVSNVQRSLNTPLGDMQKTLSDVQAAIGGNLNDKLEEIARSLSSSQSSISDDLKRTLDEIAKVQTAISAIVPAPPLPGIPDITGLVTAVGKLPGALDLAKAFGDTVREMLAGAASSVTVRQKTKQAIVERLQRGEYGGLTEAMKDLTDPPDPEGLTDSLIDLLFTLIGGLLTLPEMIGVYARPGVYNALDKVKPVLLTPAELAQAVVQGYLSKDDATSEAGYNGLTPERFDTLYNMAGDPPGIMTVLDLWNRGVLDDEQVDAAIRESRLKVKYTDVVKALRDVMPTTSDFVRFMVRDVFRPEVVEKYGLLEDYPEYGDKYLRQIGLSPEWARYYWGAHWDLPSISQVFEMLHRSRETGVTLDDVREYLRVADVMPFWRDKLVAISYNPYTRVDVRRMYKLGVLTRDQVKQSYRDIGYNEERAEKLTEFTVRHEDEAGQLNPDMLERREYAELERLFLAGKRTEADLRAAMKGYGWSEDVQARELAIAHLKRESRQKVESKEAAGVALGALQRELVNNLERLYAIGQRPLSDIQKVCQEFGWTPEEINLELQIANLLKEIHYKPSRSEKLKEVSIGTLMDAMNAKIISEDEARKRLLAIGVSETSADLEIANAKWQAQNKVRGEIIRALEAGFKAGEFTEVQAIGMLGQYKFSPAEAGELIGLWSLEKLLTRKRLSETMLARLLRKGIISREEYAKRLAAIDYTDDDIALLLRLRGDVG